MEIPDNVREGANRHRQAKHAANPEARRQRDKDNYYKNHEESLKKAAEQRNTEARQEYMKEFRKSENGLRANKISKWKQAGVQHPDFDELYKLFKETKVCADCDIILVEGNKGANRKCLDHDHETGLFRDIICHKCNIIRGQKDNLKKIQEAISKLSF
jgi:hypothetical protein